MVQRKGPESITLVEPRKIVRDARDSTIKTTPREKTYQGVYSKRRLLDDGINTLPYGYRK